MPATSETTLGRRAGNDAIAQIIATYARNQARIAAETFPGDGAGRHIEALNGFGDFLSTRHQEDQRIYTLYRLQAYAGDSDSYKPGETQSLLFGRLGMGGGANAPLLDATLNELVAAAIDDYLENSAEQASRLRTERDEAQAALETSEAARELAKSSSLAIEQLEADLVAANAELDDLRRQNTHLRAMVAPEAGTNAERPDWTAVEGYPNISERPNAQGETVYRIGWRDDDGKQRWKTTGPNLADAIEARTAIDDQKAVAA
jgi:hypothetical protein